MKKSIIVACATLLFGCAHSSVLFNQTHTDPISDKGTVVFYREPELNFLGFSSPVGRWAINANDKTITALSESTYSKVVLPTGQL